MKYKRNGQVIAYRSVTAMAIDTWDSSKLADKKKERQKRIFNTSFTTNESKNEDQCKSQQLTRWSRASRLWFLYVHIPDRNVILFSSILIAYRRTIKNYITNKK